MLVIGYPKSGNTWLCYLLSYILNTPFISLMQPGRHPHGSIKKWVSGGWPHRSYRDALGPVYAHHRPSVLKKEKYRPSVNIVRDGRDVAVSHFHYLYEYRPRERARERQSVLRRLVALARSMRPRPSFSEFVPKSAARWKAHLKACAVLRPDAIVKYESLNRQTEVALAELMEELSLSVSPAVIAEAVEIFSFRNMSGRQAGDEDPESFLRKGVIGDWRTKFTPNDAVSFNSVAGDMLRQYGYSLDP